MEHDNFGCSWPEAIHWKSYILAGCWRLTSRGKGQRKRSSVGFWVWERSCSHDISKPPKKSFTHLRFLTFCFPKTGWLQVVHIDAYCKKHQRTTGERFMSSNAIFPAEVILQMFVIMWRVGHQVQAECRSFFPRNFPLPEKQCWRQAAQLFGSLESGPAERCHPFFHPQRLQALQAMNHWLILMFLVCATIMRTSNCPAPELPAGSLVNLGVIDHWPSSLNAMYQAVASANL